MPIHFAKKIFITLIVLFFVTGCATKHKISWLFPDTDTDTAIEKLIADHEYAKAIKILNENKDKKSDSYTSRKKQLSNLISEFEKTTISKAGDSAGQDDFHNALMILEKALEKVPQSTDLDNFHKELVQQRDRRLDEIRINILLSKANFDFDQLKLFEKESHLIKSSMITRWQMDNLERSLKHFRKKLLDCNIKQKKSGNLALAVQCLQMALKIQPDKSLEKNLKSFPKKQPKELSENKKARPPKASLATPSTSVVSKQTSPDDSKELSNKSDSDNRKQQDLTEKHIEQYMKQGDDHYRAGRFLEARETWQKVLLLNNEHKAAKQQISRAEKILNSLDSLKKAEKPLQVNDQKN